MTQQGNRALQTGMRCAALALGDGGHSVNDSEQPGTGAASLLLQPREGKMLSSTVTPDVQRTRLFCPCVVV